MDITTLGLPLRFSQYAEPPYAPRSIKKRKKKNMNQELEKVLALLKEINQQQQEVIKLLTEITK